MGRVCSAGAKGLAQAAHSDSPQYLPATETNQLVGLLSLVCARTELAQPRQWSLAETLQAQRGREERGLEKGKLSVTWVCYSDSQAKILQVAVQVKLIIETTLP